MTVIPLSVMPIVYECLDANKAAPSSIMSARSQLERSIHKPQVVPKLLLVPKAAVQSELPRPPMLKTQIEVDIEEAEAELKRELIKLCGLLE